MDGRCWYAESNQRTARPIGDNTETAGGCGLCVNQNDYFFGEGTVQSIRGGGVPYSEGIEGHHRRIIYVWRVKGAMLEYFVPGSHIFIAIDVFFIYSFLGWVMECMVITYEQKHLTLNRGFVHGPFCIIYGFGAMIGYALIKPFAHNPVILFIVGAVFASLLELLTAKLMIYLFGFFIHQTKFAFIGLK